VYRWDGLKRLNIATERFRLCLADASLICGTRIFTTSGNKQ
jgi:hypothetical protein